ncbi:GAF domain-containing protein [uncultured Alsobacter sp.]|uniref:GAF domain-containing protein n=1 Tax=uncultured Alsobacter sp. TaxID=1748258 RepID=UPI0025D1E0EE|nr:GAF domain-containing protein [uncultured Alsobacter sp.]
MSETAPREPQPAPVRLRAFKALRMPRGTAIPAMNNIAKVAMAHLRVPCAVVTLFEEDLPYVVGRYGADGSRIDGTEDMSRHVIDSDDVVAFDDLETHDRYRPFAPKVDGQPVRFFAAAPMVVPMGVRIGTVCIFDYAPRIMNLGQRIILRQLAAIASDELKTMAGCPATA